MRFIIFCTFMIGLFIENGNAQWRLNGVAVCDTVGKQHIAANGILSDGEGGTFVVWGDNRDNWDIYAQRVDSTGRMLWDKQGKPICVYPGWQFAPVVTPDGEGGFVTAWGDTRNDTRDVYAQRVDNDGNILWNKEGLAIVNYDQFQGVSDILMATDSTFIMVWRDDRFFPDSSSIGIQKITKDGLKLWQDDGIRVSNVPGTPKLVTDEKGGAFVIWAGGKGIDNILVQHIDKNGNRLWNMPGKLASLGNASWTNTEFSVCPDGYGGAYIAWDFSDTDHCYIQRVDSLGNRLWGDTGIQIVSDEISQNIPVIHKTSSDSLIYLWQDNFFTRMQVFSKDGNRKFPMGLKLTNYQTSRYISSVYQDSKILISHPEITNFFPNEFIVKAQKTNTSGFLFWDSSGVTVSSIEFSPDVVRDFSVSDGNGGMITAWDDDRNDAQTLTDIYIQRVYSNGTVGGDTATVIKPVNRFIPRKFNLKVYPNPFNNSINIEFFLTQSGTLDVTICSINGRRIWNKKNQNFSVGKHILKWQGQNNNGREVSSGIYFISVSGQGNRVLRKALLLK